MGLYMGGTVQSSATVERVICFYGGDAQDHHYRVVVFSAANPAQRWTLDTMAQTLNGAPLPNTFNGGVMIHGVAIDRSGRYAIVYPANDNPAYGITGFTRTNGKYQIYVWDIDGGSIYPITWDMHPYGHTAYGYGVQINQDNNALPYDAVQYQRRPLDAFGVARPVDLINPVMLPKEVQLDAHPNWNNASPTADRPFVDATERYGGAANTTPWRAWDDEILLEPSVPGGPVYRVAHHRSADVLPDGTLEFWATPRPQISPDSEWIVYTSNWGRTLGTDGIEDRQDVFLVSTTQVVVPPPPPPQPLCSMTIRITDYQRAVARSDPKGLLVYYDITSPARVSKVALDLSDGEHWGWTYDAQTDGRTTRARAVKPVTDGVFTGTVTAWDVNGCSVKSPSFSITVVK
jgi:hypothetical protein